MTIQVPAKLRSANNVNAYSDAGSVLKDTLHSKGKALLRALATELALQPGTFDVRSNLGGIAVSGEVTLHADHLYVQLLESCTSRGLSILYRSCSSRKDYTGDQNHWVSLSDFADEDKQESILAVMRRLIAARTSQAIPA